MGMGRLRQWKDERFPAETVAAVLLVRPLLLLLRPLVLVVNRGPREASEQLSCKCELHVQNQTTGRLVLVRRGNQYAVLLPVQQRSQARSADHSERRAMPWSRWNPCLSAHPAWLFAGWTSRV